MQYLALLLGSVFTGLVAWFTKYVTAKVAIYAALTVIFLTLTAAFILAINTLYLSLGDLVMPGEMLTAACWVVPSNADEIVSVYISARVIRWAYWYNRARAKANVGSLSGGW